MTRESELSEAEVMQIFAEAEAIVTDDHLVFTSGAHGNAYVNKDAVFPRVERFSELCREIANRFVDDEVDVVIGPVTGGALMAQWVAHWINRYVTRRNEVVAVYADKAVVREEDNFVIKRGYDKLVYGKRVLVVEDILNTGGSARKVVKVVKENGGIVVGVGVLCNRGGVTADDLGSPELFALMDVTMEAWPEEGCPLCEAGVPVNTALGHGKAFLARKKKRTTTT